MKKFIMGPYGVELTAEQEEAIQGVIDNYNVSRDGSMFVCEREQMRGFYDEILIALDCVKEPKGGF